MLQVLKAISDLDHHCVASEIDIRLRGDLITVTVIRDIEGVRARWACEFSCEVVRSVRPGGFPITAMDVRRALDEEIQKKMIQKRDRVCRRHYWFGMPDDNISAIAFDEMSLPPQTVFAWIVWRRDEFAVVVCSTRDHDEDGSSAMLLPLQQNEDGSLGCDVNNPLAMTHYPVGIPARNHETEDHKVRVIR